MAQSRPFAYNTGASISGTTQFGSLIVGDINADYGSDYGGVKWWGGPDEDLRYIIGTSRPGGQPVPPGVGGTAQVGFWGTPLGDKTDSAFLNLANYVGSLSSQPPFATTNDAVTWLNANGYYTSYTSITPTPTATLGLTPTPTGTPVAETPTPTPTETEVLTPTPTETEVLTPTPTETPTPTPTETEVLTPTPTVTATPTETPAETPTNTPTPTSTDSSSITTYTISGCTNLNVLVVDLGPGAIVLGDVNYYTFTGATPSGCYSVIGKINAPIDDAFTTSFGTGGCNDCESTYITPTPTPTNTETPTATPTPTSTPTPTPTSGLVVTISEVGSDVIMSGSGSLNVTGLIEGSVQTAGGINGTLGYWVIGQTNPFFARKFFGNNLNVYPNSFGSGYTAPTSYSGQTFGIQDGSLGKDIILPIGYTSGSPLSGTATFANKTISSMGLTPGTYLYDWGSDSITLLIMAGEIPL
jgi:hypothetical protein